MAQHRNNEPDGAGHLLTSGPDADDNIDPVPLPESLRRRLQRCAEAWNAGEHARLDVYPSPFAEPLAALTRLGSAVGGADGRLIIEPSPYNRAMDPLSAATGAITDRTQTRHPQCADAVVMIRPGAFGANPETLATNRFQLKTSDDPASAALTARQEFDGMVAQLRAAGITVHVFADRSDPICPDAVFPNNWFSTHPDGRVVLYPMLAPSRRLERRHDILAELERSHGYAITQIVDLTHHEQHGHFLEGTGSMVLDHAERIAYACLSPRTHLQPLQEFCDRMGYDPCVFTAHDAAGVPVYHTNVLLSIGQRIALVCSDNIVGSDRERVLTRLAASGRSIEVLDLRQTAEFAGNALELRAADGEGVLAMSARAAASLGATTRARLEQAVERLVCPAVPTIERLGGGSVRCMLAEVFLPRREPRP